MTHVVLHPHSNTNDSHYYLVVEMSKWVTMMDNGGHFLAYQENHYDTYNEAHEAADEANAQ